MWIRPADPTCLRGREKVTLNFVFPERILQVPNTKQTQGTLVCMPCCGAGGFYSTAGESGVMLFSGVPKRKTRSRRSEQNPLTLQGQSHTDALWGTVGTTDGRFAPQLRVAGSPEQDGKPLAFFFSLSWEPLVWCHKVADDTESWSLIVHVMKVAWT